MSLTRQELGSMNLQRLAYILPQNAEEEAMVKEIFDQRASKSTYQTLTTIDVKQGWQEQILQKYVNEKKETMAPENPASLTPEEESNLDASVITKEKELELQEKLDKRNKKQKGIVETTGTKEKEVVTAPIEATPKVEETVELEGSGTIDKDGNIESGETKVKKITRTKKK